MDIYGPIESLSDFIEISEKIKTKSDLSRSTINLWWRGQSNCSWKILPSLYRSKVDSFYEREITRDFCLKSIPFLNGFRPQEPIEWMFLMQHHGAPTRLVDWSESALVALFFAVEQHDQDSDAVVWVINPWALNIAADRGQSVPTTKSPFMKQYIVNYAAAKNSRTIGAKLPIAVRIEYGFNRAHSQRGMATIHGSEEISIDDLLQNADSSKLAGFGVYYKFSKILINKKYKLKILKSLYEHSFGWEMLFPDLDGLAKSLSFRYSKDYFS